MITPLWSGLATVPHVKKPLLTMNLFHLNSCPAEFIIPDSLPIWSLPKTSLFQMNPFFPISSLIHHCTWWSSRFTQRVLREFLLVILNNWWVALGQPYSNEELGLIRDRMALRYGQEKSFLSWTLSKQLRRFECGTGRGTERGYPWDWKDVNKTDCRSD